MSRKVKPKPTTAAATSTCVNADAIIHHIRRKKIPEDIRDKAELWMEIFTSTLDALLVTADGEPKQVCAVARDYVEAAGSIADAALDVVENRWPGVPMVMD